jgi:hypothetical protein
MKARQLIADAASVYSGPTAAAVKQAFDEAWAAIASSVGNDPAAIDDARQKLAAAILNVTMDGSTDVGQIKRLALMMMKVSARQPESSKA